MTTNYENNEPEEILDGSKSAPYGPEFDPGRALTPKQVSRIQTRPSSLQKLLEKSFLGKVSPRQAIKMQCLECNGWSRKAVRECADNCCPLWLYRPTKSEADEIDTE